MAQKDRFIRTAVFVMILTGAFGAAQVWNLSYDRRPDVPNIKTGDAYVRALATYRVNPEYPSELVLQNIGGVVVAALTINEDNGRADAIQIVRTTDPRFTGPVTEALAKWHFRPATVNRSQYRGNNADKYPGAFNSQGVARARVFGKVIFYFTVREGVGHVLSPDEYATMFGKESAQ